MAVPRDPLDDLRRLLGPVPPGPVTFASDVERLLAHGWDALTGDDGGMAGVKLPGRTEKVVWQPPVLTLRIERHGATVLGSTRAEVQAWAIDLDRRTRTLATVGRRQVRPPQPPLDVAPLAQELAAAVLAGRADDRLKWDGDHRVRVLIGKVLPARSAVQQTLAGRRKRLREALARSLAPAGWRMVGANVYSRR